jgi:hypothetical protein
MYILYSPPVKTLNPTDTNRHQQPPGALFLILYGVTAVYFSGVMVRLMLVLAPAVCCLAGVAVSDILNTLSCSLKAPGPILPLPGAPAAAPRPSAADKASGSKSRGRSDDDTGLPGVGATWSPLPKLVSLFGFGGIVLLLVMYTKHCIGWVFSFEAQWAGRPILVPLGLLLHCSGVGDCPAAPACP